MTRRLVFLALDVVGAGLIAAAAFTIALPLGLAISGAAILLLVASLERPRR